MMMMPLNNVRRRNQEVSLIFTRALQWKHTTVAVQMTLAPTATHSNEFRKKTNTDRVPVIT